MTKLKNTNAKKSASNKNAKKVAVKKVTAKAKAEKPNAKKQANKAKAKTKKNPYKLLIEQEISDNLLVILNTEKMSLKKLANELGTSSASVTRWAYRRRGTLILDGIKSAKNPNGKAPHAKFKQYKTIVNLINRYARKKGANCKPVTMPA